jgi:hypothetical protein
MNYEAKNIVLPPEFSGPSQLLLFTRYGDPRKPGWDLKWINHWHPQVLLPWFPAEELRVHKHLQPLLEAAFLELKSLGLHTEIHAIQQCHKLEHIHDSPVLSVHSWGAAIDLNAAENPSGSVGSWSKAFIDTMVRNGLYCGQNWTGKREPMHFAMVDG